MPDEKTTERARTFGNKDELARTISAAISGPLEIRKEEKQKYLGSFQEDVLAAYTKEQLQTKEVQKELHRYLDPQVVAKLLINGKAPLQIVMPYVRLAQEKNLPFMMVTEQDVSSPFALVLRKRD